VSLLVTAMDFILLHDGIEEEINLPPDMCSRTGHPYNLERNRQEWTNHQIRDLVSELKLHGIKVHLSVFPHYIDDRFHHEWTSDYPELHSVYTTGVVKGAVSVLKRFDNGDWFEDLFIEKLVATLADYGFDGWHGCDGFGPLSGGLNIVDFSDDLVEQFASSAGVELPESVSGPFGHEMEGIRKRAAWIWENKRREWVDFYVDRWTVFWGKVVNSLHSHGQTVIINSSWGRAPFEALYRYGIDYRKIAATGVDGMLVETVAASLSMDPRSNCSASIRHYDFLAMLMLVKASVPELPLIFLQATQDAADELWDVIHHTPTAFEREMYSLSNVFIANGESGIDRCVEGPLYCLGDGIKKHEWEWMESWRELSFSNQPNSVLGATLIWDDDLLDNQLDDYLTTRNWSAHRLLYHLMSSGAPVQQVANLKHLDSLKGAILVLNAHQLSA
ncbi:MAG: hypothetical protein KAG97_08195, partial [Victivallales bacterium]|nr:hypothetical protein [Victivallales bacterium]